MAEGILSGVAGFGQGREVVVSVINDFGADMDARLYAGAADVC